MATRRQPAPAPVDDQEAPRKPRKYFEVERIRENVNEWLAADVACLSADWRKGVCDLLDFILEESDTYYGWKYLELSGFRRDEYGIVNVDDRTRRSYLTLEELEADADAWLELQRMNTAKRLVEEHGTQSISRLPRSLRNRDFEQPNQPPPPSRRRR